MCRRVGDRAVMIWLRCRSWSVAVFPDGRRVVSASRDETLKAWDVETGRCVATLEGHSEFALCGTRRPHFCDDRLRS